MATIVILEHEFQDRLGTQYMLYAFADRWRKRGHDVVVHRGLGEPPPGDVAVLHHDLTVVPEPYRALAGRYPRVINGATADITKGRYSGVRLNRGDAWDGPVFVKTEANHGGHVDDALRRLDIGAHGASSIREMPRMDDYFLCESIRHVPDQLWSIPGVIIEKYIPERDERGSYMRIWTFFGAEERSNRYRSNSQLIRFDNSIDREPVEVPAEIRELRGRLGFDYGKFDYVRHGERYVLLDANRTPGGPAAFVEDPSIAASLDRLAGGIEAFLR